MLPADMVAMNASPIPVLAIGEDEYVMVASPVIMSASGRPARNSDNTGYLYDEGAISEAAPCRKARFVRYPGETLLTPAPVPYVDVSATQAAVLRDLSSGVEEMRIGPLKLRAAEHIYDSLVVGIVDAIPVPPPARGARFLLPDTGKQASVFVDTHEGEEEGGWVFPPVHKATLIDLIVPIPHPARFALHLRATETFVSSLDGATVREGTVFVVYGGGRSDGEYLPQAGEELVRMVEELVLDEHEWCVVRNPVDRESGRQALGRSEVVVGPKAFFLLPGEELACPPASVFNIHHGQALACVATANVAELGKTAGETFLLPGPLTNWIPPLGVEVQDTRSSVDLGEFPFGVYVEKALPGDASQVRIVTVEDVEGDGPKMFTPGPYEDLAERGVALPSESACPYVYFPSRGYGAVGVDLPADVVLGVRHIPTGMVRVVAGPARFALAFDEDVAPVTLPQVEDGGKGALVPERVFYLPRDPSEVLPPAVPVPRMAQWASITTEEGCSVYLHLVFVYAFDPSVDPFAFTPLFDPDTDWAESTLGHLVRTIRPRLRELPFRKIVFEGEDIIRDALVGPVASLGNALVVQDVSISAFLGQDPPSTVALNTLLKARDELNSAKVLAMAYDGERESQARSAREVLDGIVGEIEGVRARLAEEVEEVEATDE